MKRKREENRQKAIEERKCFECGGFGHMASNCRNMRREEPTQVSSNRFKVLKVRVIQRGEESGKEVAKDKKEILREEKAKRGVERRQKKKRKEKKEKILREVVVKIGLMSSSQTVDLVFLYFTFYFYFHSVLFFYFLFLEQLGLVLIGHTVTSVTT